MKKQTAREVELRFTSILERSTNNLWGAHFRVPDIIAKRFTGGSSRRVVCSLNRTATYQCALLPHGDGTFVITVNKKLRNLLGLSFGETVQVALKKDESKYGLPLPPELDELLKQDTEGSALFHALTPGKRRTLLYIVGSAKNSDKRIARAIIIIRHLKVNKGKINYRQLSISLKDPHSQSKLIAK